MFMQRMKSYFVYLVYNFSVFSSFFLLPQFIPRYPQICGCLFLTYFPLSKKLNNSLTN